MSTTKLTLFLLTTTIFIILSLNPVSPTTEFVFNANFSSTNLLLFGNATIQSSILSLTNDSSTFSMGRALYPFKIPTKTTNTSSALLPFSTSFIFSVAPVEHFLPGHGFAFLFSPHLGMSGTSSVQHLGLFNMSNDGNSSNHVLAVEFDVFKNQEFQDIDFNHVGLNLNSLTSVASHTAGFWGGKDGEEEFEELKIVNGVNYQVWIEYLDSRINVTMAPVGRRKPRRPLISEFVNLSGILVDEMYAGFTGATGQLVESHRILAWSFSNTNFSIGDALVTRNLPSFVNSKGSVFGSEWFIVGVSVVGGFLLVGSGVLVLWFVVFRMKGKKKKENEDIEDWELEYWPHRFGNRDIYVATEGFSEKNVIGFGGNGRVYKGVLAGGIEVAVKRISLQNEHGMREFLAEVSSLGRLKHRNLVGLRGWCKSEQRSLVLVYDYMEKGSLDKRIFECKESMLLSWGERIKVLKDVACGILYLHEGWESKVLHRDIKASNVLLDKDMNARLGDFGLARMHDHGQLASTTRVVGTVGYMAPEMVQTGRASVQTDVYGYGVLVLEVVCGRRPNEEGKPGLVDWVWRLMETGELVSALDVRLKSKGGYSMEEVEKVLYLGLLCVNPESQCRPTMREVLKVLEMKGDALESTDDEGMEVSLLEKMRSTTKLSKYRRDFGALRHPTFEEIRRSHSSSISLSGSDIIRVCR